MLRHLIRKFVFFVQVTLLDPKKSMNVNIFLKQFRKSIEVIIDLLRAGDPRAFGVEKLKGLSKVLPQTDEVGVAGDSLPSPSMAVVHPILSLSSFNGSDGCFNCVIVSSRRRVQ